LNCLLVLLSLNAGIDQQMYEGIHSGWHSRTMDVVMSVTTAPGNLYAVGGSTAALYLSGPPELQRSAGLAACSWLGAMVVLIGTRAVVNRPRPNSPEPGWLGSAFPSSHATSYFAVATVYAVRYPRLAPALGVAGAMVALSRVYLGQHWPSDVLAGAALGTGVGLLIVRFEKPISRMLGLEGSRVGLLRPAPAEAGAAVALVTVSF
jgi:undecaprenyl-diphosphatase